MKRLLSLVISLGILAVLYWRIHPEKVIPVFANCSVPWLIASLLMVAPLTLLTSARLCQLMPRAHPLGFLEANRLILLASVLNLVLPSKMGDMAKSVFMADRGHLRGPLALALVVFEKACDLLSLLVWCVFGLLLYPSKDALFWAMTLAVAAGFLGLALLLGSKTFAGFCFGLGERFAPGKVRGKLAALHASWIEMHGYFWRDKAQLARIAANSLFIWFLHLVQIWMFTLALRTTVPFLANLALSPLAILAGLLPLTFAGVGTRDAALVFFYQPYMPAAAGAALGVLCTLRYVLPALLGLPFLGPAIAEMGGLKRLMQRRAPQGESGASSR
ncbi:MAG: lysylphosphatidylglycerol synthase transmembrane domain-containing protein [Terrimicrobiaceae bacterium]|nr:lysylphosphatidylglycerol synthase transmembrane domain-containing protein [Terrimicrobiaceae bacterium]